ncbi:MAG: NUDIX domain-containing protein [Caulobacterales bacterium]|nr:NUDIX domain-containing protein [Caulobacterales bacterium]
MAQVSAGVLAWRGLAQAPEFLLVHPGGPYWAGKDEAAWSIPKGLVEAEEDGWAAAAREFREELGLEIQGEPQPLTPCKAGGGKVVHAWLVAADLDVTRIVSNTFEIEWPPHTGRRQAFPEVDRAGWFDAPTAAWKIHKGQRPILAEALQRLGALPPLS